LENRDVVMDASEVFLTHEKFGELFGAEISAITDVLNKAGAEKCSTCGGKCCKDIGCRLYSEKFSGCPIYDIRPRECRYHFCHDIFEAVPLSKDEKELLQKPINEFFGGDRKRLAELFPLFPTFPLTPEGLALLGIEEDVNTIMNAVENGEVDGAQAKRLLTGTCLRTLKR